MLSEAASDGIGCFGVLRRRFEVVRLCCRRLSVLFNPGVMLFVPDCPVGGAAGFFQYEMLCPFFWQGRLQTGSNLAYDVFMSAGRLNGGRNPPHSRRFLALLCSVAL